MPGHAINPLRSIRAARQRWGNLLALRSIRGERDTFPGKDPLRKLRDLRALMETSAPGNPLNDLFLTLWAPGNGTAEAPYLFSRTNFSSTLGHTPDPTKATVPYVDTTAVPGSNIVVAPDDMVVSGWANSWEYVSGGTGTTDPACPCYANGQSWDCLEAHLRYMADNPTHLGAITFAPDDPNAAHYEAPGCAFDGDFQVGGVTVP